MDWSVILNEGTAAGAAISAVAGYLTGKRRRKQETAQGLQDTIDRMQGTIDMLLAKNQELYARIIEVQDKYTQAAEELGEYRFTIAGLGLMKEQS